MLRFPRLAIKTCLLILLLVATRPAQALEPLRPSLAEMSKQIAKLLRGRNEDSIAVGAFTGPARVPSSAGRGSSGF
jgi:hypothetical protein